MSKLVLNDDIFQILKAYERELEQIERALRNIDAETSLAGSQGVQARLKTRRALVNAAGSTRAFSTSSAWTRVTESDGSVFFLDLGVRSQSEVWDIEASVLVIASTANWTDTRARIVVTNTPGGAAIFDTNARGNVATHNSLSWQRVIVPRHDVGVDTSQALRYLELEVTTPGVSGGNYFTLLGADGPIISARRSHVV